MARKNSKLAERIHKNIQKWNDYFSFNNKQFHDEMNFVMGAQWEEKESRALRNNKKVPLIANKLGVLANHLLGEQRQNTPSLQVVPDETVDEHTAQVRESLVKDITLDSNANVVYQNAFQCAIIGGFGAFRISSRYENERSFRQVIEILSIIDPTKAFWDVGARLPSKVDGMHCGIKERMSREKFRQVYGQKIECRIGNQSLGDDTVLADNDSVLVIDYYEREYHTVRLRELSNGRVIEPETYREMRERQKQMQALGLESIDGMQALDVPEDIDDEGFEDDAPLLDPITGEPVSIFDERDAPRYTIKYYKVAGEYELESSEFPAELLPIIFVDQNSYYDKSGKQFCRPFFKDAKDSQKYLNYIRTHSAYLLKVSRYDQFLVSKENVRGKDTMEIWKNPGNYQGGLFFDKDKDGFVPQQLRPPELSASLTQQYQLAMSDIQTSTGMYDTQMGEQGNEISGAAIDARTQRGSYNTYVAFDSLNRAIATGGEIINQMIPHIYDTERTVMLTLPDVGFPTPVNLNRPSDDYGMTVENDMTQGHYKIRLLPGPSGEGQRQQALESLQMVLQANPQLFNMIADLYAENLPLKNNINLRNRLKTLVPPEILEAGKTGKPLPPKDEQPSPEEQAAMMEARLKEQELQIKMADVQLKQQKLQMDSEKDQAEIALKWQELENERLEAAAELEETQLRYLAENQRTHADMNIEHAKNLVDLLTHIPKP